MLQQKFVCPTCGAAKIVAQREGQTKTDYFNRLPAQIPCDTKKCGDYAKPVEEVHQ